MIIINNGLAYRQDIRNSSKMLENIERGMLVESNISFWIKEAVRTVLADVEISQTDQATVDSQPDLILKYNGKEVRIEIQTAKALYNGYSDIGPCFHIKEHKLRVLESADSNVLSYICHDTGTGSKLGVYLLEPKKIHGLIKKEIQIFGNKPGYIVPVKNNLIPGNNLDSTIPSIVTYLKD